MNSNLDLESDQVDYDEVEWQDLLNVLRKRFNKNPNVQSILFLIGHKELGQLRANFSKEEKQDLIHLATCRVLSQAGYYRYVSTDEEGWPHYELIRGKTKLDGENQENLLKREIIRYFAALNKKK